MSKRTFYKDGKRFLMTTGECPKGFERVLFVVWEGEIGDLKEGVRTADQLKQLEKVDEIDRRWADAFATASGIDTNVVQKTAQTRVSSARNDTPMDEFIGHCAAGTDPIMAAVVSGIIDGEQSKSKSNENIHACAVWACITLSFILYGIHLCL